MGFHMSYCGPLGVNLSTFSSLNFVPPADPQLCFSKFQSFEFYAFFIFNQAYQNCLSTDIRPAHILACQLGPQSNESNQYRFGLIHAWT